MAGKGMDEERAGGSRSQAREAALLSALRNSATTVIYQDGSGRYRWGENVPDAWTTSGVGGLTDDDIFTPSAAALLAQCKSAARAAGATQQVEIEMPAPGGSTFHHIWIDADAASGIVMTAVDVTDRKRREQTLRTLLREVSHRSKNLLAIIQSVAAQTGRHSGTIGDFLARFRGRLQSLASSQDLVTSSNWRGAGLVALVREQAGRFAADPEKSIVVTGPDLYLTPNAALHLGLGLHELAVNSVTHGALGKAGGVVQISVAPVDRAEWPGAMLLVWSEPYAHDASGSGFGGVALERVVPASLNSTASLSVEQGRLRYRLLLPQDSFQAAHTPAGTPDP